MNVHLDRILPFGLSILGSSLMLVEINTRGAMAASIALLLGAGIAVGWKLSAHHKHVLATAERDREIRGAEVREAEIRQLRDNLHALASQVISVWGKQIDASRKRMDEAFVALTSRFSEIVHRLNDAVSASRQAVGASSDKGSRMVLCRCCPVVRSV